MESLITVIIVTSPVRSNPDTYLIDTVLKSLSYVDGMRTCPVLILLDHYILADTARPKSGKITSDMAASYDEYYAALLQQYLCPQYRIVKSDVHLGFAMSVKWGLEMCTTEYAMIIQHDRSFSRPFSHVENALRVFAEHSHVRYIGFTTSSSVNHENTIAERYRLKDLVEQHNYIRFTDEFILKPLIFWYDSTHFCHVRRYLEIYSPFKNIPAELKNIFGGNSSVKEMILRNGDFIEDRFGQAQRHILTSLREKPVDLLTAFRWFGSYLICDNYTYTDRNCKSMESAIKKQTIFVHHLRGRTYDPAVEDRYNITGAAECPGGSIASHHEENAIEENSSHTDEEIRACSQLYNAHTFV